MNTWYYRNGAAQLGPVDDEQMAALVASGAVTATTPVWAAGMAAWTTAGAAGLCGAAAGAPVPPPVQNAGAEQMRQAGEMLRAFGGGAWASLRAGSPGGVFRGFALAWRILALLCIVLSVFKVGIFGVSGAGISMWVFESLDPPAFLVWLFSLLSGAFAAFICWSQSLLLEAAGRPLNPIRS